MTTITFGKEFDYPLLFQEKANAFAIITDTNVEKLYGKQLLENLRDARLKATLISFPAGEKEKTRSTKEEIENRMLEQKFGRDSCVIALGGGVVTDIAGFVAATYCRGIPFFSIPTTLLAMVDASIGGKTGVNVSQGKNMIGAFHSPEAILIDPSYLLSLSEKEMRCGMAEVIKHALLDSVEFVEKLENSLSDWQNRDLPFLERILRRACAVKEKVISSDPFEQGLRRILNFGHTIGHAIELVEGFAISHGEAVAMGIAMESELSVKMNYLPVSEYERICALLLSYGFSLRPPRRVSLKALKSALAMDKKSLFSLPRFVVLKKIGEVASFQNAYCTLLKEELIDGLTLH